MKKYLPLVLLLGCFAFFAYGIVDLFELRFEGGDVYPPYSSLRADPLGTMALYESLGKMPGVSARRDFSANNQLPEEPGTVYLHLAAEGGEWDWLSSDEVKVIKDFVNGGGRLVVTYAPETSIFQYEWNEEKTNSIFPPSSKSKNTNEPQKTKSKNTNVPPFMVDKSYKTEKADKKKAEKKKKFPREKHRKSLEE